MSDSPRWELYTLSARRVIERSSLEASRLGSPVITELHLMLGTLFEDGTLNVTRRMLEQLGAHPEKIYADVNAITMGKAQDETKLDTKERPGLSELGLQALLQAEVEATLLDNRYLGSEHIFLGLLHDESSLTFEILKQHGVSRHKFLDELMKLLDS